MSEWIKSLEFKIELAKKRVTEKWDLYVVKDSDWPDSLSEYWMGTENDLINCDTPEHLIRALVHKHDGQVFVERF